MGYLYVVLTIVFTVYSQIVMKWQVSSVGQLPSEFDGKVLFVFHLLLNPWVLSGVFATFLAGVSWMCAMTKFEISQAFPFMGLNYIFILAAGYFVFGESLGFQKILGTFIVIVGLIIIARG